MQEILGYFDDEPQKIETIKELDEELGKDIERVEAKAKSAKYYLHIG